MREPNRNSQLKRCTVNTSRRIAVSLVSLVLTLGAGCSSSSNSPAATNSGNQDSGAQGNSEQTEDPIGTFIVRLVPAVVNTDPSLSTDANTQFQGIVRDGPLNSTLVWQVDQTSGPCKLYKARAPFCDPSCESGSTCVNDGLCKTNPKAHSVGDLTVTGLKLSDNTTEFTVTPTTTFNYALSGSSNLLYPPADEGAAIRLKASGGDYKAFELSASGVLPLTFNNTSDIPLQSGQPLTLEWVPKGAAGNSTIEIQVNVNHHGGSSANITCKTEDDGSLVIPADMVSRLTSIGYSGFPQVDFVRKSLGSATIAPGRVELQVLSSASRNLAIPGLTSCQQNGDCSNGQTCLSTKQCG
jgi:hypothetical protein